MPSLKLDDHGRPIPQIVNAEGTDFEPWKGENGAGRITGDIAHDEPDSGRPVKIGGRAVNLSSMPADVSPGDRVNASFDQKGRLLVRMDLAAPLPTGAATETTLAAIKNDGIRRIVDTVTAQITGSLPLPAGAATEATLQSVLTALQKPRYANLTILSQAVRSTSGLSDEFEVGDYKEATFFLNVTAVSGTDVTLDVVIETKDPVSGEWFEITRFNQVTETAKEHISVTGGLGSVIRAVYSITGGGASFTFSLGAVVK